MSGYNPAPPGMQSGQAAANLRRAKTMTRTERRVPQAPMIQQSPVVNSWTPWVIFSRLVTLCVPPPLLRSMGMPDKQMQQAWREKVALCVIIACAGMFVAFVTVGLSIVLCPPGAATDRYEYLGYNDSIYAFQTLGIFGWSFNISNSLTPKGVNFYDITAAASNTDISNYFIGHGTNIVDCLYPSEAIVKTWAAINLNNCNTKNGNGGCLLNLTDIQVYNLVNTSKQVGFDWDQLGYPALKNWIVIDGNVLNLDPYFNAFPTAIENDLLDGMLRDLVNQPYAAGGKDATLTFFRSDVLKGATNCLVKKYYAGHIDKATPGCFASSLIVYISLVIVLGIIFTRFAMAMVFSWFLSWRLAKTPPPVAVKNRYAQRPPNGPSSNLRQQLIANRRDPSKPLTWDDVGNDLFSIMLVTCYSEGEDSMRATIESLAATDYPDDRKMLFVIADGIINGAGNSMSTPDIVISMMELEPAFGDPQPQSYMAVAQGAKQHNMAKVYCGFFRHRKHRVPMIAVVKCGGPEEQGKPKPGNRGKRDSQLILMSFFSRVTYNERMCPLDYDLFQKIHHLMGVTPDFFEIVLMVDADTKVYETSLRLLINAMQNDPLIMGLCGETKIANKRDSWVTMIQVYEYYISHHLGKGFESIFGGVTCLPGCFCTYRIKARKGTDDWIPILTKPEIVQEYSQNVVDTLHQKNLLLLGEDRFLTTLMLRNFPYRKMMFMPQAICKTVVPDEFNVLLSQRRRWINSTIHNLMELVLVRNLCGTFCFSMQFVVGMDLVGTIVLPVALCLMIVLVVSMSQIHITTFQLAIPLVLLCITLFSPALLILLTTRKWIYVLWMGVYILALPIWNGVLPLYAFWHFDDFSWGETRKVDGEKKGEDDHGKKDGDFDPSRIPMKRWDEYQRMRIRTAKRMERKRRTLAAMTPALTYSVYNADERILQDANANRGSDEEFSLSGGPDSLGTRQTFFDPSKEAPGRALSGYYPSYTPGEDPGNSPTSPNPALMSPSIRGAPMSPSAPRSPNSPHSPQYPFPPQPHQGQRYPQQQGIPPAPAAAFQQPHQPPFPPQAIPMQPMQMQQPPQKSRGPKSGYVPQSIPNDGFRDPTR